MAILTGQEIKNQIQLNRIRIGNYNPNRVQPNSYDLTLGNQISFYKLMQYINYYSGHDLSTRPIYEHLRTNVIDVQKLAADRYTRRASTSYTTAYLDTAKPNEMTTENIPADGYILLPNTLYLVETVESVWSNKYVTEVSGTSSLARLGVTVHKTAGYANIGHEFKWILEVEVTHPVKIYQGMKIGQMYFHTIEGDTDMQYAGKYKNEQMGDTLCGSLNHLNND